MEELVTIFGLEDDGHRPITEVDCQKLTYLEACIQKTLRVMPQFPSLHGGLAPTFFIVIWLLI